jgi:type II secretory pathway pseudopilin PulG
VAVASIVIAILAFLLALASFLDGRRQARDANRAAARSADAAEQQLALAEAEAARYPTPWRLTNDDGSTWILTNGSDEAAVGVTVRPVHDSLVILNAPDGVDVGPGSAVSFVVSTGYGTSDFRVRATWRRPGETYERDWTHSVS